MSIDYRTCECGETFADCADGVVFCNCGMAWCSEECAAVDGYREEVITHEDGSEEEIRSCNFCREDDFGDKELFDFATSAIGVSRDNLVAFYKEFKDQLKKGNICKTSGQINFSSFSKTGDAVVTGAILTGTTLGTRTNKKGDIHE